MLFFLADLNLQWYSLNTCCHQKICKGCPIKFCDRIVARGNAVQIFSNFPAKRQYIEEEKFSHTFYIVK